jgi:hypothetical protein
MSLNIFCIDVSAGACLQDLPQTIARQDTIIYCPIVIANSVVRGLFEKLTAVTCSVDKEIFFLNSGIL